MSCQNVKVKYIRPAYKDLREWMDDINNVYIGRGGIVFIDGKRFPPKASNFCNPYKIGHDGTRDEVILKYENYIRQRLKNEIFLRNELLDMNGKNLGCWCKPDPCHGDVLLKLIIELQSPKNDDNDPGSWMVQDSLT